LLRGRPEDGSPGPVAPDYGWGNQSKMVQHQILPLANSDINFDTVTAAILDTAYGRAIPELHDRGPDSVRKAIAKRTLALASAGERDPNLLCDKALVAVGYFR
jgi:hypothetical protein